MDTMRNVTRSVSEGFSTVPRLRVGLRSSAIPRVKHGIYRLDLNACVSDVGHPASNWLWCIGTHKSRSRRSGRGFPDWQHTTQGERLVQKELRRKLLKYKLHTDQELVDKAYGYIRQYY